MAGEEVLLIDAFSQIFRAYYAIRSLSNSRGEPTNAVFVFTRLLLKLQQEFPGRRGALLFDCGRVAFRQELAPDYKANRPPMPEDLSVQVPVIREMAEAFGWPLLEEPEYEADDLIAAIARAVSGPVRIISSDKDLAQLVDDRVRMLVPDRKNTGFEERDAAKVVEKFGVVPELLVDYLALLGDSSDNIPGVPGVGQKTAALILNTLGPAETWLADPGVLAGSRYREKLEPFFDRIENNRRLIRLRDDLPSRFDDLETVLRRREPDWEKIRGLCEKTELRSILRELPSGTAPAAEELEQGELF